MLEDKVWDELFLDGIECGLSSEQDYGYVAFTRNLWTYKIISLGSNLLSTAMFADCFVDWMLCGQDRETCGCLEGRTKMKSAFATVINARAARPLNPISPSQIGEIVDAGLCHRQFGTNGHVRENSIISIAPRNKFTIRSEGI